MRLGHIEEKCIMYNLNRTSNLNQRFKIAKAFNLFGLIVAFAAFYLLMTQLIYQATFNHSFKDSERLYLVENDVITIGKDLSDIVCRPYAEALSKLPQVESVSLIHPVPINSIRKFQFTFLKKDEQINYTTTYCNNTGLSTLTDRVVDGIIEWTDEDQNGIIIPESIAFDYFDTNQAAGKEMIHLRPKADDKTLFDTIPVKVIGVYEDFPENCEMLNYIYTNLHDYSLHELDFRFKCIFKIKKSTINIDKLIDEFKEIVIEDIKQNSVSSEIDYLIQSTQESRIKFVPIKETYFEHNTFSENERGYLPMFIILIISCFLVIIIATINFQNFKLAECPSRIRGINTRHVLGQSKQTLRNRIILQCVYTSTKACLFALLLCYIITLFQIPTSIVIGQLFLSSHKSLVLLMIILAIIIGFVVGIYPAIFSTSFTPSFALKTSFGLTPEGKRMRTILIRLQLFISILMLIYIGVLYLQGIFILKSDYGFDKDQIMLFSHREDISTNQKFIQDLKKIQGVESVSFASSILGGADGHKSLETTNEDGNYFRYYYIETSNSFFRTLGIRIIDGRGFSDEDSVALIMNEAASKQMNWMKIGSKVSIGWTEENINDSASIIGICENIRFSSTRNNNNKPFFFLLDKSRPLRDMIVRCSDDADTDNITRNINLILHQHFGEGFVEAVSFRETLDKLYSDEIRYINQISFVSMVCIIITIIGVFCLTLFETEYRRKEIGIRKVMGATKMEIIGMLFRSYTRHIIISFAFSSPFAYVACKHTLAYFAEHISIPWWIFPLCFVVISGIVFGVIFLKSWSIASENPVNSIKSE